VKLGGKNQVVVYADDINLLAVISNYCFGETEMQGVESKTATRGTAKLTTLLIHK
jgi:hypothetical protein